MSKPCFAAGSALLLAACPAAAHVVAGARTFPVTLNFDDPGVGDELSLPSFGYTRSPSAGGAGPLHQGVLGFEYDKRITENTALIFNNAYSVAQQNGAATHYGWQNIVVTGKWQFFTSAPHETVLSAGIQREFSGTGATAVGGNRFGATTPTFYFGKGMGDLPDPWRPFAITGELSYTIADRAYKLFAPPGPPPSTGTLASQLIPNRGNSNAWAGGLSVQYSIPYLQAQVKDLGLRGILAHLYPVVEFTYTSTATDPKTVPTAWLAAPGFLYEQRWGEIGIEATLPLNRAAGTNAGLVGLVHFYLDDLLPGSLGKPLFD